MWNWKAGDCRARKPERTQKSASKSAVWRLLNNSWAKTYFRCVLVILIQYAVSAHCFWFFLSVPHLFSSFFDPSKTLLHVKVVKISSSFHKTATVAASTLISFATSAHCSTSSSFFYLIFSSLWMHNASWFAMESMKHFLSEAGKDGWAWFQSLNLSTPAAVAACRKS